MEKRSSEELPPKKILVVDDEKFMTETLKAILETSYLVWTANDGREALEFILTHDYDLVISDVIMPRMNGIDLYYQIKEKRPGLEKNILFISGSPSEDVRNFLRDTGNRFLYKPFSIQDIQETVRNFFSPNPNKEDRFEQGRDPRRPISRPSQNF